MQFTKDELVILYNCLNSQVHVNPRPEEQPEVDLLNRLKAELKASST